MKMTDKVELPAPEKKIMNATQDPAGSRLAPTTSAPDCITVRVKTEYYGKGYPGYNTEK